MRLLSVLAVTASASCFLVADARADDPINTIPPKITGIAAPGRTLTASTGTWQTQDGSAVYAFVWLQCNSAGKACTALKRSGRQILGKKIVVPKGVTGTVRVSVLASDAGGTGTALSAPVKVRAK
jgi:hypothetical protein